MMRTELLWPSDEPLYQEAFDLDPICQADLKSKVNKNQYIIKSIIFLTILVCVSFVRTTTV